MNSSIKDPIYHLECRDVIQKEDEDLLYMGISNNAFATKEMRPMTPFSILLKDADKNTLGGATGVILYGALYTDLLWVDPKLRASGWGTKLMLQAETIGKKHSATFAVLNTMDWEALPFYQKLGYSIEFVREGFEKGSKMYMLRKSL